MALAILPASSPSLTEIPINEQASSETKWFAAGKNILSFVVRNELTSGERDPDTGRIRSVLYSRALDISNVVHVYKVVVVLYTAISSYLLLCSTGPNDPSRSMSSYLAKAVQNR